MSNQSIAAERGLSIDFESMTYVDESGNEYRDESGACLTVNPTDADEAQQLAIDWQNWASEQDLSMGELAWYGDYFRRVGKKFGLTDEYRENGII